MPVFCPRKFLSFKINYLKIDIFRNTFVTNLNDAEQGSIHSYNSLQENHILKKLKFTNFPVFTEITSKPFDSY